MQNSLKMLASAAAILALAACATPATGAAPSADAKITAAMEGQTADDGTIIKCRAVQRTGTRFPAKECKSEKAWEEFDKLMAENAKSSVDGFQRLNTGCSTQSEGSC